MPRIELAQLLRPTTTPEQELLLEHFYNQFDNRSAANRQIVNVEPLYYQGAIAGTEFLVYAATKLYLCYNITVTDIGGVTPNIGRLLFYDETNAISLYSNDNILIWNTVTSTNNSGYGNLIHYNNYFSRISVVSAYTHIKFTGYRITLI